MRTLKELNEFYNKELLPELLLLEKDRIRAVRKIYTILGPTALFFIFIIMAVGRSSGDAAGWLCFIALLVCIGIYAWLTQGYVGDYKDKIIENIVLFVHPSLRYSKTSYIERSEFNKSSIFLTQPNIYNGDDRVRGVIGSTSIDFSELHTQYESGHGRNRTVRTVFKGLFFLADFNKHFKGRTFVLPDKAEKMFGHIGSFFQKMNAARPDLVKLEDPQFEKHFVVYGDDQIEARYILSTSLMKRIVDFKLKSGRQVFLSFIASKVYIAITYRKNLFEPKIFQTILNFSSIEEYFEDLQMAVGIVEDLNLNTRIWSKS